MSAEQVVVDGGIEAFVGHGVAEDAVIDALLEGFETAGSGGEIHVGHPEWIEFRTAVVFDATGAAAGDHLVEVEAHVEGFVALLEQKFKLQCHPGKAGLQIQGLAVSLEV